MQLRVVLALPRRRRYRSDRSAAYGLQVSAASCAGSDSLSAIQASALYFYRIGLEAAAATSKGAPAVLSTRSDDERKFAADGFGSAFEAVGALSGSRAIAETGFERARGERGTRRMRHRPRARHQEHAQPHRRRSQHQRQSRRASAERTAPTWRAEIDSRRDARIRRQRRSLQGRWRKRPRCQDAEGLLLLPRSLERLPPDRILTRKASCRRRRMSAQPSSA